jgi:hypothetical protein
MAPCSPAKKRRKVVKASSPVFSPGTKKVQKKTKALIINQAAMDLIGKMGDDGRAPYGSMDKILGASAKTKGGIGSGARTTTEYPGYYQFQWG